MNHSGTKYIESKRLILRQLEVDDDKKMYHNWASDEKVVTYLTWPIHENIEITRNILKEWIKGYAKNDYYHWGIEIKETHDLIGTIGVVEKSDEICLAQIGYCIGSQWWHQGYMSEALSHIIDYLFGVVDFKCIQSHHDPRNINSGKVMLKCGMKYEGTLRQSDRNNLGICDASYYSILKAEWEIENIRKRG